MKKTILSKEKFSPMKLFPDDVFPNHVFRAILFAKKRYQNCQLFRVLKILKGFTAGNYITRFLKMLRQQKLVSNLFKIIFSLFFS